MGLTWLMAEIASRAFRLALPSVVLLLGFAAGGFFAGTGLAEDLIGFMPHEPVILGPKLDSRRALVVAVGLMLTSISTLIFYWRFRVPLAVAIATALLFVSLLSFAAVLSFDFVDRWDGFIGIVFCALVLLLSVRFELTDPQRSTRRSDVAFWLHALAGVWAVVALLDNVIRIPAFPGPASQIAIGLVLIAFGLIGLVIDRRMLAIAPIFYIGTALAYIAWRLEGAGLAPSFWLLTTIALMLGLMWYWRDLRASLLRHPALGRFIGRVPPIEGAAE
jgi:hypothetical protein